MYDKEFQDLLKSLYKTIQDKQDSGEYTFDQAQVLRNQVNQTIQSVDGSWDSSGSCYEDAWEPSQVCW